ncbi:MAG: iron-sulfur cluster assembly accessory protein [Planctomycetia bacterium]|nr:iron-sulfur cluster assembly accessory protein [Planctomycetia bacterium]
MTKTSKCRLATSVIVAVTLVGCEVGRRSSPPAKPPVATDSAPSAHQDAPLITLTPKATAMVRQFIAGQDPSKRYYLRVRAVPGGCMHKIDLDPDVTAADHVSNSGGISVVVFKRQLEMLRGAQVDYVDENGTVGFKLDNPNFKGEAAKKWLLVLEGEKDIK